MGIFLLVFLAVVITIAIVAAVIYSKVMIKTGKWVVPARKPALDPDDILDDSLLDRAIGENFTIMDV